MTRGLRWAVVAVGAISAIGWVMCLALGWNPHRSSWISAAVIGLAATLAGLIPLRLTRGSDQAAVVQAGLVGTVLHLFVALGACGFVLLTSALPHGQSFMYWVLAFFGATLAVVAAASTRAIRAAHRAEPRPDSQPATPPVDRE